MLGTSVHGRLRAVLVALVLMAATLAAAAQAADAKAPPKRLYACVTAAFNTLNLSTKKATCPPGQFKISWAVKGKRGKPGKAGKPGSDGSNGGQGDQGAPGAAGPKGDPGQDGAPGETGPAGSPDTPADVLAKLLTVDGPGSGLDADLLGGLPSSEWQRRVTGTCTGNAFMQQVAADGTVTCGSVSSPLVLTQTDPGQNGLDVTLLNTSGARGVSIQHNGVGPGVFANTVGGNGLWGVTGSISSAAVIGDSSSGEAVVARQNGAICEKNIGKCNGIGAIVGRHDGTGGYGVRGFVTDPNGAIGVLGQAGISGGTGTGVRAENVNAANNDNALETVTNGNGSAIFAQGKTTAATFNGAVQINGDLTVTGNKSGFRIDDPRSPTTSTLTHTPVETDAMTVTYSGNVRTGADGRATVQLPAYAAAIAAKWRYQLTPIGQFGQAIVEREVRDGSFVIATEHPRTKVSWSVIGVRTDPQAKRHPIRPLTAKQGRERGRYIDPSLYGQPKSRSVAEQLKPTTKSSSARSLKAAGADRPRLASER